MGYPGKAKKLFDTPNHPWQKARIDEETEIVKKYGLRNKKGVWKFQSELRKYRSNARSLLGVMSTGMAGEESHYAREAKQILGKLQSYGILKDDAKLEDILALRIDDLLERRLQTLVYRKGLANSMKQARQFIVHGHIAVNGRKINVPSYMVLKTEEESIGYYIGSPVTRESIAKKPAPVAAKPGKAPVKAGAEEAPKGE
ncbi:30S ribosomal protein S4 [Methanocella sp. CWC-04]|uniref:Small ribosomal subunit protein uS4 n=1 Tax=Methanooceanicella nereidis TaxID=2052831 RepID=A0AAP2RAJ6_9EURY|nr:30S ribosomal protein S4 [Methanocella sp. CWC-04]MCD1293482.1 30S ribosomal protein S4 [Methanocella sp. CWC-04]